MDSKHTEEWRAVEGFRGLYEVSSLGRVRSLRTGVVMRPTSIAKGYQKVSLSNGGARTEFYVHRLVSSAFHPNPAGHPQVNHKDGDPTNNAVENLEWVTNAENVRHASRVLGKRQRAVYSVDVASGLRNDYPSIREAVEAGFKRANIQKCIAGERTQHGGKRWFDAAMLSTPKD